MLAVAGEMAEWSIALVLKTGGLKGPVGSNPTLSATSPSLTAPGLWDLHHLLYLLHPKSVSPPTCFFVRC
jgi:hypothetical protein